MSGIDHPWLFLSLRRSALLSFLVVGLCASSLLFEHTANQPAGEATAAATDATVATVPETSTSWPRIVLRLWFLAPQIVPPAAR